MKAERLTFVDCALHPLTIGASFLPAQDNPRGRRGEIHNSVVSVLNVSFKQTNLLSERSEWNHFMNWFVPFSVQLSSAVSMLAESGTAATHTENCEDVTHVRAVIRSWFANLLHTELLLRTWWFSFTYCTESGTESVSHSGQKSWCTFSNRTAKISAVLLTSL